MANERPDAWLDRFTADAPRVHTRAEWRAKAPRRPARVLDRPPDRIIVHHTDTANTNNRSLAHAFALSRRIQRFHMGKRGWDDTGQQLTISRGGFVMEGRNRSLQAIRSGRHVVGAQVLHQNEHTIGIENEGRYNSKQVPARLWSSLIEVCVWLCAEYQLDPAEAIVGHRDYNRTECPGDVLYARLPALRRAVAERLGGSSPAPPVDSPQQPPDGPSHTQDGPDDPDSDADGAPPNSQMPPNFFPGDDEMPMFPHYDDYG
nr:peptidoglycan recognition family protein [Actinomadura fibrosa]